MEPKGTGPLERWKKMRKMAVQLVPIARQEVVEEMELADSPAAPARPGRAGVGGRWGSVPLDHRHLVAVLGEQACRQEADDSASREDD